MSVPRAGAATRSHAARRLLATIALLTLAALAPPNASAQYRNAGDAPTRGVLLPGASATLLEDAAALEVNPAQAGWLRSWEILVAHTELSPRSRYLGTGTAIFGGVRVPYLPLHVSVGLQVLRPARGFGDRYPTAGKLSLGLAARATEWLSLGIAGHVFVAPGAPGHVNGLTTLDAGITLRPTAWLSLALGARDLTSPSWAGLPLQRRWDVELGLRPLGTDTLGVALGVNVGERRQDLAARLVIQGRVYPGVTLFADATWRQRDLDDADGREDLTADVRTTVGLRVSFGHAGLTAAFVGGAPASPGGWAAGGAASLRITGAPHRSVLERRSRVLLVDVPTLHTTRGLLSLLQTLHLAQRAPGLRAVILKIGPAPGWAHAEELRAAIHGLRRAGRKVYAYLYATRATGYYVAAAADRIYAFPGGGLRMAGLSSTRYYVKGLLDKLGVRASFIRFAEYKTAPEPLLRTGPSREANEVRDALLGEFSHRLYAALAARPKVATAARARALLARGPFTAAEAKVAGLVDGLVWPDKVPEVLRRDLGAPVRIERPASRRGGARRWRARPAIAVVPVEGDLIDGRSRTLPLIGRHLVGAETLIRVIGQLAADPRVRAIVIRVESGGGSALGSEAIWRALRQVSKTKPVVASFGNVAASGGYFVGAGARQIFASPSTLTGSIGIFTGKADLSGLLARLGITTDVRKRGPRADVDSWLRPYTPAERLALKRKLRTYYHRFLDAVAAGRARAGLKTRAQVAPLARGRLWSGAQAKVRHLVDHLGGLWPALQAARRLAGLPADPDAYAVIVRPKPAPSLLRRAMRVFLPPGDHARSTHAAGAVPAPRLGSRASDAPRSELAASPLLRALLRPLVHVPACLWALAPSTPLAHIPYELEIR